MIIDAHCRIGDGREVELKPAELIATMDALGIDRAVVAPGERCTAYDNREGNELTAVAAAESGGRLLAYAVANPWRGRAAIDELDRALDAGAVALAVDSTLQGFDLLDGLLDPLLDFATDAGWFVYVRTGTPPTALPLPLATLARRRPELPVIMGKSGATDFWIDAVPALLHAPNLYGDTAYAPWDTVLTGFQNEPGIGAERLIFATDAPYTVPVAEVDRIRDWPLDADRKAAVFGGNLARLLAHQ
ncbi:amidohydrolase family protein [Kribbella sandramycini]|uniref:Amidohydrolase family protein n=1 Tax=Kribbella sandramycini TaxID=60450 RepID=A0A7Y4KUV5_9ACTN|nr:amidohydrolase family protein [Kribbella sandramycini]MBB6568257.1 putative TIM-barrel fold metal-dependent hydrolase [Kribbella sandramycini]NOL39150.1 amidohydrolase family protein [Kribbella sandramycini]